MHFREYGHTFLLMLVAAVTLFASVQPPLPVATCTNSVVFDSAQGSYEFKASSSDGTLSYLYSTKGNGSLNALTCSVAGGAAFHPSCYGGFIIMANGFTFSPWNSDVGWTLLSATTNSDTLTARWRMSANGATFTYSYKMYISGRTLVLRAVAENPLATQFTLDRSKRRRHRL